MKGEPAARLLALALLSALACGAQQPTAEDPNETVSRVEPAVVAAEPREQGAVVVRDFYADYLDNDYSKFCLRSPTDFLVDGLEQPEEPYDFLEEDLGLKLRLETQMMQADASPALANPEASRQARYLETTAEESERGCSDLRDSAVEDGFDVGVEPRLPIPAEPGDHEEDQKRTGQRHGGG